MASIDWQTMSSRHICNLFRALYSFKWVTTRWHNKRVRIKEIDFSINNDNDYDNKNHQITPGNVEFDRNNKCLRVYCIDGKYIRIKCISMEGKHSMTAADFNNGFLKKVDPSDRTFS